MKAKDRSKSVLSHLKIVCPGNDLLNAVHFEQDGCSQRALWHSEQQFGIATSTPKANPSFCKNHKSQPLNTLKNQYSVFFLPTGPCLSQYQSSGGLRFTVELPKGSNNYEGYMRVCLHIYINRDVYIRFRV